MVRVCSSCLSPFNVKSVVLSVPASPAAPSAALFFTLLTFAFRFSKSSVPVTFPWAPPTSSASFPSINTHTSSSPENAKVIGTFSSLSPRTVPFSVRRNLISNFVPNPKLYFAAFVPPVVSLNGKNPYAPASFPSDLTFFAQSFVPVSFR